MIDNTRALRTLRRLCDTRPLPIGRAHRVANQLQQDIEAARAIWRKIVFVPDAPILRLSPEDMLSVNDSRNVTIIPAEAA